MYYSAGKQVVLSRLGMKTANLAQTASKYVAPAAAGAGFGGGAGFMYAPEGHRLEGALTGAGLGATGAVAGKAAIQALNKGRGAMAKNNLQFYESQLAAPQRHSSLATMADTDIMAQANKARGTLQKLEQQGAVDEVGGAMLGAVTGTAGAMNKTENVAGQRPYSQRVDPYGYSRR